MFINVRGRERIKICRLHKLANILSMSSFVIQGIIGVTLFINLK